MPLIKSKSYVLAQKNNKGFTLLEMILVIIILGIMGAGISGFITLSTQTYLNATNRDELVGNARFVIERLNRELRNALPNSIRIKDYNGGQSQCLQFTPIAASTVYSDIPVAPEVASETLTVIPFNNAIGNSYQCDDNDSDSENHCDGLVTVYPLTNDDIYQGHNDITGKTFLFEKVAATDITLENAVHFNEDSPTQRLYLINNQVSYCATSGFIYRYEEPITIGDQVTPPASNNAMVKMAGYLNNNLPFNYQPATLKRNAVVQIHLAFAKNDESYVFNHEIHINNVP
ncbi:PilW family protein [Colwellia echini]|uniref:Type II secretion system protein n=1 Tax=Colwellia echini TaxID=1982103 RepID=A0ABY3N1B5_9GAMM|nr:type II secretion system protein [Colwellia echini]TYK67151.1 type II secretion system protein [Colwellia echini]